MSQQKNAPPPAPLVVDEKPKLAEPQVPVEQSKLSDEKTKSDTTTPEIKELTSEISIPKTQADLGAGTAVGSEINQDIGSDDIRKP